MRNPGSHYMLLLLTTKHLDIQKSHYLWEVLTASFFLCSSGLSQGLRSVFLSLFACPCTYLSFSFFLYLIHFLCSCLYHTTFFFFVSTQFALTHAAPFAVCFPLQWMWNASSFVRIFSKGFTEFYPTWEVVVTGFAHLRELSRNANEILMLLSIYGGQSSWKIYE